MRTRYADSLCAGEVGNEFNGIDREFSEVGALPKCFEIAASILEWMISNDHSCSDACCIDNLCIPP